MLSGMLAQLPGRALAEEAMPDIELLYYLGSWEGSDEDWVLLSEQDATGRDADANSEESQESDDER